MGLVAYRDGKYQGTVWRENIYTIDSSAWYTLLEIQHHQRIIILTSLARKT